MVTDGDNVKAERDSCGDTVNVGVGEKDISDDNDTVGVEAPCEGDRDVVMAKATVWVAGFPVRTTDRC